MEYCDLHKDLSDEEGEGCPLCECLRSKREAIIRVSNKLRLLKTQLSQQADLIQEAMKALEESSPYFYQSTSLYNKIRALLPRLEAAVNHDLPGYQPKTPLGKELMDIREKAIAKGMKTLSVEEIIEKGKKYE